MQHIGHIVLIEHLQSCLAQLLQEIQSFRENYRFLCNQSVEQIIYLNRKPDNAQKFFFLKDT
ncbi:Uncharacterised protein [Klebsiella pneumoniae]|nr:Uncharacterised protein [Klebsiella pneumoniae]VGB28465.1 Uncharacterised protein [Klebsiella pneumoniae]